ncbi:hypothetical protein FAUST_11116 [Fusarium austroamericanum]|uniref:Uncharacterized protein n=1 Tax=Fusarium austroamericanum TaxID=282268 RepID=A0AAN5Z1Y1_FUSAU|nr:hypothetical protein FAUST_11116 [Fusarium austroamericanum]
MAFGEDIKEAPEATQAVLQANNAQAQGYSGRGTYGGVMKASKKNQRILPKWPTEGGWTVVVSNNPEDLAAAVEKLKRETGCDLVYSNSYPAY